MVVKLLQTGATRERQERFMREAKIVAGLQVWCCMWWWLVSSNETADMLAQLLAQRVRLGVGVLVDVD